MRILLLNYEYPPLGGGAANATKQILREFSSYTDISIDLIASSPGEEQTIQLSDTITLYLLDINKNGNIHYQTNADLLTYSRKAKKVAKRLLKENNYDLVHAFFGIPCGFLALFLGKPFIVSLRGSDVPFYNERFALLDRFVFSWLSTYIWKKSAATIANSKQLADLAQRTAPKQDIPIIKNGVDTTFFKPDKRNRTDTAIRILTVSRLIERKGIDTLVRAFASIQNQLPQHVSTQLHIIGDGNQREALEILTREKGISEQTYFHGPLEHEQLAIQYANADLFVLPSKNEGMSNTALEALASGLPLILTDTGGAAELVKGNGALLPLEQIEASLETALLSMIDSTEQRAIFSQNSRKKALELSWSNTAAAYYAYYEQISAGD